MKQLLVIAGAAALAFTAPALAKPGNGHGNGHGPGYGYQHGYHGPVSYGVGGCPPGLAKKHNGCMPPGQAKKYNVGQRFHTDYGDRWRYSQIPYDLRRQYALNPYDRYYYSNGYLYRVDPKTMLIEQVVSALIGR